MQNALLLLGQGVDLLKRQAGGRGRGRSPRRARMADGRGPPVSRRGPKPTLDETAGLAGRRGRRAWDGLVVGRSGLGRLTHRTTGRRLGVRAVGRQAVAWRLAERVAEPLERGVPFL